MRSLKIYLILFSLWFAVNQCNAQIDSYIDFEFESFEIQADSIKFFMSKALEEDSKDRDKWERKFFCAFPSSYNSMDIIFGYKKKHGPLLRLGSNRHIYYGSMSAHIDFFSRLTSIPYEEYYNKYINICINGYWQADFIRGAFGFGLHLLNNPGPSCEILAKRTDNEVLSVLRFIFDGPHPDHEVNRKFYKMLLPIVRAENKRLSKLLTQAFDKLINENHQH